LRLQLWRDSIRLHERGHDHSPARHGDACIHEIGLAIVACLAVLTGVALASASIVIAVI
jgi:hypothetical protein